MRTTAEPTDGRHDRNDGFVLSKVALRDLSPTQDNPRHFSRYHRCQPGDRRLASIQHRANQSYLQRDCSKSGSPRRHRARTPLKQRRREHFHLVPKHRPPSARSIRSGPPLTPSLRRAKKPTDLGPSPNARGPLGQVPGGTGTGVPAATASSASASCPSSRSSVACSSP